MPPTARVEGDKIVIQTRGVNLPTAEFSALVSFIRSLPRARFDRAAGQWTCDATPGAAWRIVQEQSKFGHWITVEPTHGLWPLAAKLQGVFDPVRITGGRQPEVRRTDARRHQIEAYNFAIARRATLLHMDMGTGKTKVAIDLAANWGCRTVLVLCPKSVIEVWQDELAKHAAKHPALLLLTKGTTSEKVKAAQRWVELNTRTSERSIWIVLNYESARMSGLGPVYKMVVQKDRHGNIHRDEKGQPVEKRTRVDDGWLLKQNWDLIILDESHRCKAPNGKAAHLVEELGRVARRRLCLTGTPMPHSPMDIFSQFRFLDPGLLGTAWTRFRQRYAVMGGYENHQIVEYQNLEELERLMGLITYQCGAEVLDLPEATDHVRRFELSKQAQKHYDELEADLITEIEGGTVTAANALVRLLRLQQVTSGYLRVEIPRFDIDPAGVTGRFAPDEEDKEIDTGKAELLAELLEDIGPQEEVVVFCRFVHDLDTVKRVAEQLDRGGKDKTCGEISGRMNEYRQWKAGEFSTLAIQPQAGSLGIDLTEACYTIYYSLGFSLGDYLQGRKRTHRPGQARPVHYYHLLAKGTVDEAVLGAIRKKEEIVNSVLGALRGESHERCREAVG